jgi:hypothetical protein
MDASDLLDALAADHQTELSRLGSSKALYADTEGQLEPDRVLGAMADDLHHAATTLRTWTDETDPDGVFTDAADRLEAQYETLAGELDGHEAAETTAAAALADAADPLERLGALVGWVAVLDRKASQVTGFFTGQADPQTASLVRSSGEDFEAIREAALSALSARAGDSDLETAQTAAAGVIQAAYDEYVETLESMGVNPKPVC